MRGEEAVDIVPTCESCFKKFSNVNAVKYRQLLPPKSPDQQTLHNNAFLWSRTVY